MTNKSICARCAELIRIKVSNYSRGTSGDKRKVCPLDSIRSVLVPGDTVEECSRFVEVPKEDSTKSDVADNSTGKYPQEGGKDK